MNLSERDQLVIWHPFTQQKHMQAPIPIVKGEGALLIDDTGNQYIDAISSWWVNLHGHAHPFIAQKVYEQASTLEQVIFAGFTHAPAVELAENLLEILPNNFARIFFSDNGSTSTEVALKMALQYWWNKGSNGLPHRNKILAFQNSYHGDTFGAMSVSDRGVFTLAFHDKLFEVTFIEPGCQEETLQTLDWKSFACFIYEPLVQGAGCMRMYDSMWLNNLLKKCRSNEVICIADEVMTGFGRTGKIFASEWIEERPDIICLSKGLTGGTMALGVTACVQKIYDAYVTDEPVKTFFHGHSFTANPLACTAANASISLLKKKECTDGISMLTAENEAFLYQLKSYANIKNLRALGTILAFELITGKDEYLNKIGPILTQMALNKGIFLRPLGNTVYIMPPYCMSREQLHKVYQVIRELIDEFK